MPCNWPTTTGLLLHSIRTAQLRISHPLRAWRNSTCGLLPSSVVPKRAVLPRSNIPVSFPHTYITLARPFCSRPMYSLRAHSTPQARHCQRLQCPPTATSHRLSCMFRPSNMRCVGTTPPFNSDPPQTLSSTLSFATAQLSDAQVSRVAAQAVRLCIHDGDFGDALYVVNSACHSVLRDPLSPEEHNDASSKLQPIAFGRPVSPRLAAHAFLHGLVRKGYALKAQTYAKLMVQAGIPIHRKTMEAVIASVRTSSSVLPRLGPFARMMPRNEVDKSQRILELQPGLVTDACARAAVELLQTARTFGQRRTERMYHVLISTLLMQGEIIVATLLFVLLVKDWEVRKVHETAPDEAKKDWLTHEHLGTALPTPAALLDAPYPDLKVMGNILDKIDKTFARTSDSTSHPALFPSLQSLALFAMFLDTGQVHTHRIASLIRTMYHCPKSTARVWILRDGQLVFVKAYPYFHSVLKRIVNSLTDTSKLTALALSRRAYNALLSYSLRHQFSPGMASKVLNHMCVKRCPPITPDIVTYNVLLRSGTLLRQLHISEAAIAALRSSSENLGLDSRPLHDLLSRKSGPTDAVDVSQASPSTAAPCSGSNPASDVPPSNLHSALARLDTEKLDLPQQITSPAVVPKVNPSTLTSFVAHLTSTGRPESITPVLFDILPELFLIDHPATTAAVSSGVSKMSRHQALRRAAQHGPYIYASLTNALAKAGEVGLAERVFILAQQAERASHVPSFGVQPWRLSVEAYTSMMQCYAKVARGRLLNNQWSRHYLGTTLLERDMSWRPKARHNRQGYAQFIYRMQMQARKHEEGSTKHRTARRNAMLLYRSMMSGGRSLLQTMILSHTSKPMATTPRRAPTGGEPSWFVLLPDERFFNVALKMFSRPARRVSTRSQTAAARRKHDGAAPTRYSPLLGKLARAVVNNGYSIPERYHRVLARRWKGPMTAKRPRRRHVRRPYAFSRTPTPTDNRHSMAIIPTVKTRGLPVRKKMPAWMRRRRTPSE